MISCAGGFGIYSLSASATEILPIPSTRHHSTSLLWVNATTANTQGHNPPRPDLM